MPDEHVPSLSYIVDAIQARIEYDEVQGLIDEQRALVAAKETIVNYAMGEYRNRSIIATILARLSLRRYAA